MKVIGIEPDPAPPTEWVEIEHDGVEGTKKVHPRSVRFWTERCGWRVVARPESTPAVPAGSEE